MLVTIKLADELEPAWFEAGECKIYVPGVAEIKETAKKVLASFVFDDGSTAPAIYINSVGKIASSFDIDDAIDCILSEAYLNRKRPFTSYLPFHYHLVPAKFRVGIARTLVALKNRTRKGPFPNWPIDGAADLLRDVRRSLRRYAENDGSNEQPDEISWPGAKRYALCLTHDIDTKEGFRRARNFMELESEFGFASCWFVVLKNCRSNSKSLEGMIKAGNEIGCHGDNHDERLAHLGQFEIEARLERYKDIIADYNMRGFRSPCLSRTQALLKALGRFFEYDSTFPDTEISSRFSHPRGCCSVLPYYLGMLMELPLTMPQDSAFVFSRKTPEEMLNLWIDKLKWIKAIGGLAVLNVHPDSHFGMKGAIFDIYRRFLEVIQEDKEAWVTTPSRIVRHCSSMGLRRVEI